MRPISLKHKAVKPSSFPCSGDTTLLSSGQKYNKGKGLRLSLLDRIWLHWMNKEKNKVLIISGPSGAGKSTLVRHLLNTLPMDFYLSISLTTRAPRHTE